MSVVTHPTEVYGVKTEILEKQLRISSFLLITVDLHCYKILVDFAVQYVTDDAIAKLNVT